MHDPVEQKLIALFIEEVKDRTSTIEKLLLDLEALKDSDGVEAIVTDLLRIAHSLKGAAGFSEMRSMESACHWMEDTFTAIKSKSLEVSEAIVERLLAVNDVISHQGQCIARGEPVDDARLLALMDEGVSIRKTRLKDAPVSSPAASPTISSEAAHDAMSGRKRDRSVETDSSVKLSTARLDALLFRIEELLLLRLRNRKRKSEVDNLLAILSEVIEKVQDRSDVSRLSKGLRELSDKIDEDVRLLEAAAGQLDNEVRRARMLPFNFACNGLTRVVRDTSAKLGKSVRLVIEGGEVEVDRSIVNNINDLLRHLIRNAIDHGIEDPEQRKRSGKSPVGKIVLRARTTGDRLRIKVIDDGRGIDIEALREVYRRMGHPDGMSERVLLRHIFTSGFSTADTVTEISGRGVGLDIVKRGIERMRGVIEASNNPEGGTTFAIALPLLMSSTRALIASVGEDQRFALETAAARRIISFRLDDLSRRDGNLVLNYGNKEIPALDLGAWLVGEAASIYNGTSFNAVIIGTREKETAILVQRVVGEEEILVRSLGPRLAGIRKFSGAASLQDGSVILITSPSSLVEAAVGIDLLQNEAAKGAIRILVVDDSPSIRARTRKELEQVGMEVFEAEDGARAWNWLQANATDFVIADVDMPTMNGFELTSKIRKSKRMKALPVLMITAREGEEDKQAGLDAGATAFIRKSSCSPEKLIGLIRGLHAGEEAPA